MPNPESTPPSLPLVAYAESLCQSARVLLVGDARSALIAAVLRRGARLVHVWDGDAGRRAQAQATITEGSVSFGSADEGPATFREAFFDLVLIENLAAERDVTATLGAVGRALSPRGSALIAAPNPETTQPLLRTSSSLRVLDYYSLYDTVKAVLPHVRMLGQVPFVGYALVDFAADGEPSPVLDTSFLPARGEEPDYFVALAGRERRLLDQYAVVQLPLAEVLRGNNPEASRSAGVAAAPADKPMLANPGASSAGTSAAASVATPTSAPGTKVSSATPSSRQPTPVQAAQGGSTRVQELEQRLAKQEAWIAEIEARASTADERADAAEAELDELREQLGNRQQGHTRELSSLNQQLQGLHQEVERERRRLNDLQDVLQLKDAELLKDKAALAAAQGELGAKSAELEAKQGELRAKSSELEAKRGELQTSRSELQAKNAELQSKSAELAAKSRELEDKLGQLAAKDAELAELRALAGAAEEGSDDLARLEQQLRERSQTIRTLEQQLRESERTGRELVRKLSLEESTRPPEVSERLARAEAELVTLRWSLELIQRGGLESKLPS